MQATTQSTHEACSYGLHCTVSVPELGKREIRCQDSSTSLTATDAHANVRSPDHAHIVGTVTNAQGDGTSLLFHHECNLRQHNRCRTNTQQAASPNLDKVTTNAGAAALKPIPMHVLCAERPL